MKNNYWRRRQYLNFDLIEIADLISKKLDENRRHFQNSILRRDYEIILFSKTFLYEAVSNSDTIESHPHNYCSDDI